MNDQGICAEVTNSIRQTLEKRTTLTSKEIHTLTHANPVIMIVIFGSQQKHFCKKRFLTTYRETASDLDIGVIVPDELFKPGTKYTDMITYDVLVGIGEYSSMPIGHFYHHLTILCLSDYLEGLDKGVTYCIAIQRGKLIFIRPEYREQLLGKDYWIKEAKP